MIVVGYRRNWQVLGLGNGTEGTAPVLAAHSMRQVGMACKGAQRGSSEGLSCMAESLTAFSYFGFGTF